jgi:hypothetical protein
MRNAARPALAGELAREVLVGQDLEPVGQVVGRQAHGAQVPGQEPIELDREGGADVVDPVERHTGGAEADHVGRRDHPHVDGQRVARRAKLRIGVDAAQEVGPALDRGHHVGAHAGGHRDDDLDPPEVAARPRDAERRAGHVDLVAAVQLADALELVVGDDAGHAGALAGERARRAGAAQPRRLEAADRGLGLGPTTKAPAGGRGCAIRHGSGLGR